MNERADHERTGPGRLAWLHFRVSAMNEMQYRVNFFVQLAQSVVWLTSGLVVLALVFSRTDNIKGWTRPELLAVIGVFTLMGGVIRAFIQPAMQRLLTDVREGTLDFALTRPADAQLLVSVREMRIWQVLDILIGAGVLAVAVTQLERTVGIGDALAFAALLVTGAVMIYCCWLIISTGAFWLVRMENVQELFDGVYRAGQYPITIYPGWLRAGLTFVIPLGFAITAPSQAITSRLSLSTVLVGALTAGALVVVSRVFWRIGIRHYAGASA